jgi:hypothetical protein
MATEKSKKTFICAFARSFGYNISTEVMLKTIDDYEAGNDYGTDGVPIVDAWCLWCEAEKEFGGNHGN